MNDSHRKGFWPALNTTLCALGLLFFSQALPAADAKPYLEDATQRFEAGEYPAALIQLKNVLQIDPNHIAGRLLMARTQLKLGEPEAALNEIDVATKLGAAPENTALIRARVLSRLRRLSDLLELQAPNGFSNAERSEWHYLRGIAFLEIDDSAKAGGEFTRARDFDPESGRPIAGLAITYLHDGNLENARQILSEADRIAPNSSEVLQAHAAILNAEGNLHGAIQAYDRALLVEADNDWLRLKRASILIDAGRHGDAERALAALSKNLPYSPRVHYLHARSLHALRRHKEAKEAMVRASNIISGVPPSELTGDLSTLHLAASITYGNGELNAALGYLETFLGIRPTHSGARKMMASTLIKLGKPLDAIASLRTLTSRGLTDAQIYALLGEAYNAAGMHSEAIKALEEAGRSGEASAEVLGHLGLSHIAQGRSKAGIAALEDAIDKDPEAIEPRLNLASTYQRIGQPAKSHALIDELLRQHPEHLVGLNFKATLYASAREYDRARRIYQRILEIAPDFRTAHSNLANLDSLEGNHSAARERLARLLLESPQDPSLVRQMARVEAAAGKDDVALELLQSAYNSNPGDVEIGQALVRQLLKMGRKEQAVTVALSLKGNHPQNLSVLETVARTQLAADDRQGAQITLRSMSALATGASAALKRIARISLQAGDRLTAMNVLTKAVAQEQDDPGLRADLTWLLLMLGKTAQAQAHARILSEQYPDNPSGPLLLAEIALRTGNADQALAMYDEIPSATASPTVAVNRLRAWSMVGKRQQGIEELKAWVGRHPQHYEPRRQLAVALHSAGRLGEAQGFYEALLDESPEDVQVLNNLANLYGETGDPRALQIAQLAFKNGGEHPSVMDTLGWLHVQLGQPEKGLPLLRNALVKNPESGNIRYHLAVALDSMGRRNEAIRQLKEALANAEFTERAKAEAHLQAMEIAKP